MLNNSRLYYEDAYKMVFKAAVLEQSNQNGQTELILDQTCFYPSSGGQPHDTGHIAGSSVKDVYVRSKDGAVVHVISDLVADNEVAAEVEWSRRFDHMQNHTGQHILSRALLNYAGLETRSFHMGSEYCTIDVVPGIESLDLLTEAEDGANRIIWDNRAVVTRYVNLENLGEFDLRSLPAIEEEEVRLIDIDGYDLTACGGTHVSRTGEVGLVKIIRFENMKAGSRIYFKCGQRALADYRLKNNLVSDLAQTFTTSSENVPASIAKIQSELRTQKRINKNLNRKILEIQAAELHQRGRDYHSMTVVKEFLPGTEPGQMRLLASFIADYPKTVALLASNEPRLQFVFARSEDADGDMGELLGQTLSAFEKAKGGGSNIIAQGGGESVERNKVLEALNNAEAHFEIATS